MDFPTHPLVETAWLEAHLSDDDLRIVDARWRGDGTSRALYQSGHLPGAVHLDWQRDLSWADERGVRDLLLPSESFAAMMEAVGIGDQTRVVAYAEADHSGAARLWWALRFYGHEQVAVLNGGWTKWTAEGRLVSRESPHPLPTRFTPRPQRHWLATIAQIERVLSEPVGGTRLLDARPSEQYAGQAIWTPQGSRWLPPGQNWLEVTPGRFMRGGHIPSAIHLQASRMLDPTDWTFRSAESIGELARAMGLEPAQQIITYCGVGISASLALFALYLAGYRHLALYDASWEEWGTDPMRPVERGER